MIKAIHNDIKTSRCILKRLKKFPEYNEKFVEFVIKSIENNYDEINNSFANRLIEIDNLGYDSHGYFTMGKDIWLCFYNDKPIGFEVITRKRGGSIKLGPTFLLLEYRGNGFAKEMILSLCNVYKENGARKVYVTAPLDNYSTAKLDYCGLTLKLEAILCKNYSENSSDRVCGELLEASPSNVKHNIRTKIGSETIHRLLKNNLNGISFEKLNNFIYRNMSYYFDDIDETFTRAIVSGADNLNKLKYDEKCKDVFLSIYNNEINCIAVATPKRGGNYKVSPFIIDDKYLNYENIQIMIENIEKSARQLKRRKVTIFIPTDEVIIANRLSLNNYICEGILKEPYKKGYDIIVFSKFIGE